MGIGEREEWGMGGGEGEEWRVTNVVPFKRCASTHMMYPVS